MSDWSVYLLRCADGSLYCGATNDMARRLDAHKNGRAAKYTRSRLPIKGHLYVGGFTKSEALVNERAIKRQAASRKMCALLELSRTSGYPCGSWGW